MADAKILFLSHTPDNGVFKVGSHHLARELSRASLSVAHVSTPRSLIHKALGKATAGAVSNVTVDEFGTLHATPNVLLPIQVAKAGRSLGNLIKEIGFDDADFILIDQPLMSGYVETCRPKGKLVYRPTDTYGTNPAAARQNRLIRSSAGVVATSSAVLESLDLATGVPSLVLENGVELGRFGSLKDRERSGFIYVGAIDYRFDWDSVIRIAVTNPTEAVLLIGPVSRQQENLPSNISILGAVAYEELPNYLNQARVGLIPLNSTDVNQGRSPMKYYEYLASGLSVVATSTASLRERQTSQTFLFRGLDEAEAAARSALLAASPNVQGIRDASAQDWSAKAAALFAFMKSL